MLLAGGLWVASEVGRVIQDESGRLLPVHFSEGKITNWANNTYMRMVSYLFCIWLACSSLENKSNIQRELESNTFAQRQLNENKIVLKWEMWAILKLSSVAESHA